jgi:hypothetical protein
MYFKYKICKPDNFLIDENGIIVGWFLQDKELML